MTSNEILKADMLDILFDNRNKMYGAYTLRKYYTRRLFFSLFVSLSGVLLLFFLAGNGGSNKNFVSVSKEEVFIDDFDVPKKAKPEPPKPKPRAAVEIGSRQAFINRYKIVEKNITSGMLLQEELFNISDENGKGPEVPQPFPPAVQKNGKEDVPVQPPVDAGAPIQREPEFPGGMKAWIRFLNENLQVPASLEAGEKKTVLIRFQVATNGAVTGFEVLQSGGRIYDNEVIRVLKRMPSWKPAIQNNQPVSRTFTQPVTFVGLEE